MESHEEKLLAMVQESKMNQAREIMKQKEKELKAQQPASSGFGFLSSLFSSAVSTVAHTVRTVDAAADRTPMATPAPMAPMASMPKRWARGSGVTRREETVASSLGRGMQLSGSKKESLSVGAGRVREA